MELADAVLVIVDQPVHEGHHFFDKSLKNCANSSAKRIHNVHSLAHPSHSKCQSSIISTQINLVIICKFKSMHSIFGCIYQHGYDNQSYLLTFAISHSSVVVMSHLVKEQCMLW